MTVCGTEMNASMMINVREIFDLQRTQHHMRTVKNYIVVCSFYQQSTILSQLRMHELYCHLLILPKVEGHELALYEELVCRLLILPTAQDHQLASMQELYCELFILSTAEDHQLQLTTQKLNGRLLILPRAENHKKLRTQELQYYHLFILPMVEHYQLALLSYIRLLLQDELVRNKLMWFFGLPFCHRPSVN